MLTKSNAEIVGSVKMNEALVTTYMKYYYHGHDEICYKMAVLSKSRSDTS